MPRHGPAWQPLPQEPLSASFRCETCGEEEAKYRCPRCMKYSCRYLLPELSCWDFACCPVECDANVCFCRFSLLCVKKHKLALSCSGVRDKTAFVSVTEFTDLNLLSGKNVPGTFLNPLFLIVQRCIIFFCSVLLGFLFHLQIIGSWKMWEEQLMQLLEICLCIGRQQINS